MGYLDMNPPTESGLSKWELSVKFTVVDDLDNESSQVFIDGEDIDGLSDAEFRELVMKQINQNV